MQGRPSHGHLPLGSIKGKLRSSKDVGERRQQAVESDGLVLVEAYAHPFEEEAGFQELASIQQREVAGARRQKDVCHLEKNARRRIGSHR